MKDLPKDIKIHIKRAKGLRLSRDEKDDLRNILFTRIHEENRSAPAAADRAGWSFLLTIWTRARAIGVMASAAIVVGFVGGTSVAAQGALPGDMLYPVKTQVNERVAGVLYLGAEARAQREVELVERRLEEVRAVVALDDDSGERVAAAEARLAVHLDRLKEHAAHLEADGRADDAISATSRAEVALEAVADALMHRPSDDRSGVAVGPGTVLRERGQDMSHVREEAEQRTSLSENVIRSADRAQQDAYDLITKAEQMIATGRSVNGAQVRLENAQDLFAEGEAHIEVERYSEAYRTFRQSARIAQGIVFSLENRLNIPVGGVRLEPGVTGDSDTDQRAPVEGGRPELDSDPTPESVSESERSGDDGDPDERHEERSPETGDGLPTDLDIDSDLQGEVSVGGVSL